MGGSTTNQFTMAYKTMAHGKGRVFPVFFGWNETWGISTKVQGVQMSNEKRDLGWLGYIGDEILPSYIGIIIYNT